MDVTIRAETSAMKSRGPYAIRKIRSAFRRVSKSIRGIDLVLLDVNGPRGGIDKVSRITVDLGRRRIRLEGLGRTVRESVNDTVARAKRLVMRSLARRRGGPRKVRRKARTAFG